MQHRTERLWPPLIASQIHLAQCRLTSIARSAMNRVKTYIDIEGRPLVDASLRVTNADCGGLQCDLVSLKHLPYRLPVPSVLTLCVLVMSRSRRWQVLQQYMPAGTPRDHTSASHICQASVEQMFGRRLRGAMSPVRMSIMMHHDQQATCCQWAESFLIHQAHTEVNAPVAGFQFGNRLMPLRHAQPLHAQDRAGEAMACMPMIVSCQVTCLCVC